MEIVVLIFGILAGGFCIAGSVFNWDFFFNARKAAALVKIFGRTGARIFYIILGMICIIGAIVFVATGGASAA